MLIFRYNYAMAAHECVLFETYILMKSATWSMVKVMYHFGQGDSQQFR